MAKDRSAKEKKREKRKRQQRLRDQQRQRERLRTMNVILEGIHSGTARGLAAVFSCETGSQLEPEPHHYREFKAALDGSGATRKLQQFIECAYDPSEDPSPASWPAGIGLLCDLTGELPAMPVSLPATLLSYAADPLKWLDHVMAHVEGDLVVWLVWDSASADEFPMPCVLAMDRNHRLAIWFIDDDFVWHPATRPDIYLSSVTSRFCVLPDEEGLTFLIDLMSATAPEEEFPLSADDPAIVERVDSLREAQQPMIKAFFKLAERRDESESVLDYVVDEADRSAAQARELERLRRRCSDLERERNTAREALAREQKHGAAIAATATKTVPLVDRLAQMFA